MPLQLKANSLVTVDQGKERPPFPAALFAVILIKSKHEADQRPTGNNAAENIVESIIHHPAPSSGHFQPGYKKLFPFLNL